MQRAARAQAIVSGSKRLDCHCSIDEPNTPTAKRLLRRPNVQRGPGTTGGRAQRIIGRCLSGLQHLQERPYGPGWA
jgi:hypothetical protein